MAGFKPEIKNVFGEHGPSHLTEIDWKSPDHRRCIMASLIQGAKITERDRQKGRLGPRALAPPWYESFNFELYREIYDTDARCIFGAIYQHKSPTSILIPKYVIAFRGTLLKPETAVNDCLIDMEVILNNLHNEKRFQQALEAVKEMVSLAGAANVWLAGYSLGAAIALLAGKEMAKMSDQAHLLETYLFNPPFVSLPLEWIENQELKQRINVAGTVVRAVIAVGKSVMADDDGGECSEPFYDPFAAISCWVPHVFANQGDFVCSGFIGYFQNRDYMRLRGMGGLEKVASRESIMRNMSSKRKIEPLHLLASADLNISSTPITNFRSAHSLRQWWAPNLICETKIYV